MTRYPARGYSFLRNAFCIGAMAGLFLFIFRGQAMVDQNGNGISDIWEWMYNVTGVNPVADPDKDGYSNLQEALAGTDPANSSSFPHITSIVYSTTNISVIMPCALGKQYQLQSVTTIGATNWVVETNQVARAGTNVTLTVPLTVNMKFYRVGISDVDSDGDGLSDWEEYQLGLDPLNPLSNGQQDGNGNALGDYGYVTNMLAAQNVVTIAATVPTAVQPDAGQVVSSPGQFTITRGGFPLGSITVNLGSGGPGLGFALAGTDYGALPSSVVLASGVSSQTIALTPMANTNLAAPALAQLQLLPGFNYTIGSQSNATVAIYPSITPSG